MKARVKATGETIEIMQVYEKGESFYVRLDILDTTEVRYHISELEFEGFEIEGKFAETCLNGIKQDTDYILDYWTRLEHQYVGMAMQAYIIISQSSFCEGDMKDCKSIAHALVQELKEKEERK